MSGLRTFILILFFIYEDFRTKPLVTQLTTKKYLLSMLQLKSVEKEISGFVKLD